jgi:hypothetical protein
VQPQALSASATLACIPGTPMFQALQIDDQPLPGRRQRRDRCRHCHGARSVKFPDQRGHHMTAAHTGTQRNCPSRSAP